MPRYAEKTITYWCSAHNSMQVLDANGSVPIALTPCRKETCEEWKPGPDRFCVHLARVAGSRRI